MGYDVYHLFYEDKAENGSFFLNLSYNQMRKKIDEIYEMSQKRGMKRLIVFGDYAYSYNYKEFLGYYKRLSSVKPKPVMEW